MTRRQIRSDWLLALLATAGFVLWAWRYLDFFTTARLVHRSDGTTVSFPNALATVDHPFHTARFHQFMAALAHGHVPRWIFSHQGGYPAEFYPFGSSAVDLVVWLITLGHMSTPMVHTWAVAVVFVLPMLGFFGIARYANLSPWIGTIALTGHLCVRGWWWSGGSYELIEWGLITNVLAAALIFLTLVPISRLLERGSIRWAAAVILLTGWAEVTNPRSAIAVATLALAALIIWLTDGTNRARSLVPWRVALPMITGMLLAAPVLLSLLRYRDLYYFVNYSTYANLSAYWHSSIQAVSAPFALLAGTGLILVFVQRSSTIERLVAWSLIVYVLATCYLVQIDRPAAWTEQLETTRLMPFQRLLMFALAGIAIGRLVMWLPAIARSPICAGATILVPLLYVWAPPDFVPVSDQGLVRVGTMAEPGIVDLQSAVYQADQSAVPDTAMLILGTTVSWHDQMWAVLWTDRLLFYDDWLWYWQTQHVGAYDPLTEHAYTLDSSTINEKYLSTHGIGSIVVTGEAKPAAANASFLTLVRTGTYNVYTVNQPATTATLKGANVASTIEDQSVAITGISAGGQVVVRVNWFPRWQATVDGESAPITHRSDGYMEITVPPGARELTLTYARTSLDWAGSALAALAMLIAVVVAIAPGALNPGRRGSSDVGSATSDVT